MDLSCIILSYNSARSIARCVESLLKAAAPNCSGFEILIVDNGSSDGSPDSIAQMAMQYPQIVLTRLERNYGTTTSRNKALRFCRGKYILILDSDAYINPEALIGLMNCLSEDPSIGLAAPKLVFPDGRPQLSHDQFPTLNRKFQRVVRLRQIEQRQSYDQACDVDYAISACWLTRREVLDQVGLLDEAIFYAPEDVDYCLRIWKAGYRVTYRPEYVVIHDAQERSRSLIPNRFTWLHLQGLFYYFRKHRYFWSLRGLRKQLPKKANR